MAFVFFVVQGFYAFCDTRKNEGVAKGSEKKGTTKDTKSTKKSFSFPLCPSWFKAFKLFAIPAKMQDKNALCRLKTGISGLIFFVSR